MTFTEIVAAARARNGVNDPLAWRDDLAADTAARAATDAMVHAREEREFLIAERVAYVQYATFAVSIGDEPMPFQTDRR